VTTTVKRKARWVRCPGVVNDGVYAHSMREHCWNCAPWWEKLAVCPDGHGKLSTTGWCKKCRTHYRMDGDRAVGDED